MYKKISSLVLVYLLICNSPVHAQYNISSFNYCSYLCNNGTLPVSGLELEGNRINESTVALKWKTRSEINSRHFELERSFGDSTGFTVADILPAAGNSTITLQYKLNDPNDFTGITYYRVKEKDLDNSYQFSNTIAVKGTGNKAGIMVYPSPGRNDAVIAKLTGFKAAETIVLQVTDIAGKIMGTKTVLYNDGLIIKLHSLGYLSAGYYILTVTGKTNKLSSSFIIIN
jgi:hypothetical protein